LLTVDQDSEHVQQLAAQFAVTVSHEVRIYALSRQLGDMREQRTEVVG